MSKNDTTKTLEKSKTSTLEEYSGEIEIRENIIARAQSLSDKALNEWIGKLKASKKKHTAIRQERLAERGYEQPANVFERLGYTEGDLADPSKFTPVPYEKYKRNEDGKLVAETKYKYKLAGSKSYTERMSFGFEEFVTQHMHLNNKDKARVKQLDEEFAKISDELERLSKEEDSLETSKAYRQLQIEAERYQEAYREFVDDLTIRYDAGKLFQEFNKEKKAQVNANLEILNRKETFSILLINTKLAYLQSVVNDRLVKRDTKLANLARELIGETYKMPKPSGKRKI